MMCVFPSFNGSTGVATSNLSCRQFKIGCRKKCPWSFLKEGLCEESLLPGLFETGEAEPWRDKVKAWFDWASANQIVN